MFLEQSSIMERCFNYSLRLWTMDAIHAVGNIAKDLELLSKQNTDITDAVGDIETEAKSNVSN